MGPTEAAASRLLESLPTRPPTPPQEMIHEPEAPLKQVSFLDPRNSLHTPPSIHSPLSASKTGSTGSRKKVEFSTQPHYQEPPIYLGDVDVSSSRQVRATPPIAIIPPSSSASRPAKSILKTTSYEATISYDSAQPAPPVSIADMLASTVQQLAGADRDLKLDAYLTLARALKASDNLPDRIALQSKMSLFTQFIQRDITSAKTPAGTLDSTLVLAALDLLNTFLRFSAIASTLSNDFGVFIVDHCIRSFEVVEVTRTVLRALMRVVGLQNFPPKVMTSDRVGRLVVALHSMEEQMESRNTLLLRCMIYRTLVKNHKVLMAQHLDWLPDLFTDMLSSAPIIREAAISLGLDAGFALARERSVTQRVLDLFQATVDDEKYLDYYSNCLLAMTKDKDDSPYVPQVWSVVTLFIRTPERWDYFVPWLRIIQKCFNSGDYRTKDEANFAWARLAYAGLREHRTLSTKMLVILTKALVSQLRRRGAGKLYDDHRRVVIGTICSLYYYSMRPNTESRALDNVWDQSVKPIILQLLEQPATEEIKESKVTKETKEKQKGNRETASAILTGLINCSSQRPWQEDHIVKSPLVLPEDLPSVDAKWVRRNCERVFALVGPIMEQSFLDLATPRSSTQTLWRAVVGAAAVAAAKEVKVSSETAVFVSDALSLLLKLWTAGVPTAAHSDESDESFAAKQMLAATREFLLTMVDSLGSLPFTEKRLAKVDRNAFVAVGTPSQRIGQSHSAVRSPLHHLFSILSTCPPGVQDNDEFADFIECVFAPFFSTKSSKGRLVLALDLLQTIPADVQCPYGPWQAVAKRIASSMNVPSGSIGSVGSAGSGGGSRSESSNSLGTRTGHEYFQLSSPSSGDSTPVGYQYREVVRVLERGLRSTPALPFSRWQALFCTLCDRVREETGDAGLALCVLDPLAKNIADLYAQLPCKTSATLTQAVVELLSAAAQPRDRQAVDAAKRRLWGTAIATANSSSPSDPLDHVYRTVGLALETQYSELGPLELASNEPIASLLRELGRFFARGNDQLFVKVLAAVQDGLALWIRDDNAQLSRQNPATEATKQVWEELCILLERISNENTLPLDELEPLFCAAFSSKHRHIVNTTLTMWNSNYGSQVRTIEYPERLRSSLAALQPLIDVPIPGLDASLVDADGARRRTFIDSQEDAEADISLPPISLPEREISTPKAASPSYNTELPFAIPLSLPAKRHTEPLAATSPSVVNTASNSERKTGSRRERKRRSRAAKPRHEDSQIEFTRIDTSAVLPNSSAVRVVEDSGDGKASQEESQILTERQREVRDRQRENRVLYSDIVSSTPTRAETRAFAQKQATRLPMLPQQEHMQEDDVEEEEEEVQASSPIQEDLGLPEHLQVMTPEARNMASSSNNEFAEEFIASTPTPRRGQALTLPVNDNDPPSSPPEPRRYPLLPEMGSRSRSSSILDDWQFSSSPVSGSPIAARHTAPELELSLGGITEALEGQRAAAVHGASRGNNDGINDYLEEEATSLDTSLDVTEPSQSQQDDLADVAMEDADVPAAMLAAPSQRLTVEISPLASRRRKPAGPSTPRRTRQRSARSSQKTPPPIKDSPAGANPSSQALPHVPHVLQEASQEASQEAAKSTPIRRESSGRRRIKIMAVQSPVAQDGQDQSFHISDGDELSMLRLAVELDHQRRSRSSPTEKPASAPQLSTSASDGAQVHDCITVWTGDESERSNGSAKTPLTIPQMPEAVDNRSPHTSRRKRKRAATQAEEDEDTEAQSAKLQAGRRLLRPKSRGHADETELNQEVNSEAEEAEAEDEGFQEAADTLGIGTEAVDEETKAAAKPTAVYEAKARRSPRKLSAGRAAFEDEEVQSQLALEAQERSQRQEVAEVAKVTGRPAARAEEEDSRRPAKRTRLGGILSMLKGSLAMLRTATLSRREVHEIEDVCMDIKRELYEAERRGRD